MISWNDLKKEDVLLICEISKRVAEKNKNIDKTLLEMDISAVHLNSGLKLKELLEANDFNFFHDIFGIMKNINRANGNLMNYFVPRFAMEKESELMEG